MYYFVKSSKNKAIFVKMRKALKSVKVYILYKKIAVEISTARNLNDF